MFKKMRKIPAKIKFFANYFIEEKNIVKEICYRELKEKDWKIF